MSVKLEIELILDSKGAITGVKTLGAETEKIARKGKGSTDILKDGWGKVAGAIAAVTAALAVASKATQFMKESIALADEQVRAEKKVQQAITITGQYSIQNMDRLRLVAQRLQSVTTIGDETALSMMALSLSMGASVGEAEKIVKVAADMSVALGIDVNSAVRNVSKTLGGFAGELGEVIPELKALTKEQLIAGAGVDVMAAKFTGFAASDAQTYGGSIAQLGNEWGDLKESLGMFVVENTSVIKTISDVTVVIQGLSLIIKEKQDTFDKFSGWILGMSPGLMALAILSDKAREKTEEHNLASRTAAQIAQDSYNWHQKQVKALEAMNLALEEGSDEYNRNNRIIESHNEALKSLTVTLNQQGVATDENIRILRMAAAARAEQEKADAIAVAAAKQYTQEVEAVARAAGSAVLRERDLTIWVDRAQAAMARGLLTASEYAAGLEKISPSPLPPSVEIPEFQTDTQYQMGFTFDQELVNQGFMDIELAEQESYERRLQNAAQFFSQMNMNLLAYLVDGMATMSKQWEGLDKLQSDRKIAEQMAITAAADEKYEEERKWEQKGIELAAMAAQTKMQIAAQALGMLGGMLGQLAAMQSVSNKAEFEKQKKLRLAAVVLNTAAAVMQALGSIPPPMSYVAAAIATAIGIAQLQKIQSQKYQEGGSYAVGSPYIPYDQTASIHQGERIFTAVENRDIVSAIQSQRGGNVQRAMATGTSGGTTDSPVYLTIHAEGSYWDSDDAVDRLGSRIEEAVYRGSVRRVA